MGARLLSARRRGHAHGVRRVALAEAVSTILPGSQGALLSVIPVLMSLVGFTTQRAAKRRFHSSEDRLRFKLFELGVMFLVVRLASLMGTTPQELLSAARGWAANPFTFFDVTTIVTYSVGVAAWWMASQTAQDLDAIADPTLYAGETEPTTRLVNRFFLGGVSTAGVHSPHAGEPCEAPADGQPQNTQPDPERPGLLLHRPGPAGAGAVRPAVRDLASREGSGARALLGTGCATRSCSLGWRP